MDIRPKMWILADARDVHICCNYSADKVFYNSILTLDNRLIDIYFNLETNIQIVTLVNNHGVLHRNRIALIYTIYCEINN